MPTILLIRHADIDTPAPTADPPLNSAGIERAKALVHVAGAAGIATIFTSNFLRTKKTVEPLASKLSLVPREAPSPPQLAEEIRSGAAGPIVLIAGHSNTVPDFITALGVGAPQVIIGHTEFDNLFVVTIGTAVEASLLRLRY